MKLRVKILSVLLMIIASIGCFIGGIFAYWFLRPNTSNIHPDLKYEIWDVKTDQPHNAFTDMVYWKGDFYLTFRTGSAHAPVDDSKIVVLNSDDAKDWNTIEEFSIDGKDIRDPKFAIINDILFIYVVVREIRSDLDREITTTQYSFSEDGKDWEKLEDIEPENMRFWRPKTFDNISWYCPVFSQGNVKLYNSSDGINWEKVSTIYDEPEADETDFNFLPDGRIISIMRIQPSNINGDNQKNTMISVAKHPYDVWNHQMVDTARLDGPCLFNYTDKLFAVGRYQPEADNILQMSGSVFAKKRTALYYVEKDRLVYLSDLPSNGDTSYPAAVVKGNYLYVSYYTSDINRDYPWLIGQISPTKVYIAKIGMASMVEIADEMNKGYENEENIQPLFPWVDYIVLFVLIGLDAGIWFVVIKKFLNLKD